YDASLYDYRVGPNNSEGYLPGLASDRQVATVFRQAITDNIDIINNSWGSETSVTSLTANQVNLYYKNSIAAAKAAQKNSTLFVFAAGNARRDQVDIWGAYPIMPPNLQAVGSRLSRLTTPTQKHITLTDAGLLKHSVSPHPAVR
ncbi:MAG: S8 family serine peptidase, partial [Marinovum sp.]|nr:S8 family serine peptidase [Marinovum sp.]